MARELQEQVQDALMDVLQGGWAKYLELEDGAEVRTQWERGEPGEHRLVITHTETGHRAELAITVQAHLLTLPITPVTERVAPACRICKRPLGQPEDPDSVDCGGDCWGCMREEECDPEPVERTWAEVCAGDQAQGADGKFYRVMRSAAGRGPNEGLHVVTLNLTGLDTDPGKPFNMRPDDKVTLIRGDAGRAADVMKLAGVDPSVIRS